MDGPKDARGSVHVLEVDGRTVDARHRNVEAGDGDVALEARSWLEVIVRDLARALNAELALLAVANHAPESVDVLASWGSLASHDGLPPSTLADGFVGRALQFTRAAVEPIDPTDGLLGESGKNGKPRHAVGAPVRPPHGAAGVLCAKLPWDPAPDSAATLWLIERYAQLTELCLHDRAAPTALLYNGHLDGLTGCLTQNDFLHEFHREIARAGRHQLPVSCAFIDVDKFKRINDRYGHLHGSRVLAELAGIVRGQIRREDTIGRYGGDEFLLLLPNTTETEAMELAERLRETVAGSTINRPNDPLDVSVGVAQWEPGSPGETLLADADEALLAAKEAGGGTVIDASTLPPAPPVDAARCKPRDAVSISELLDVVAQFDQSGGSSVELAAWELNADAKVVAKLWSEVAADGLIAQAGMDPGTGEAMWRLSDGALPESGENHGD